MDASVQRLLQDKLYEKRKAGALELETSIRNALADGNHERIAKIVRQLCHDYAYAVHQPHARNGGLIGLAAAAIALGPEVARYLREIMPPVLACFSDQDARVRYYACESMYNIAKVAKGEVLIYFNDLFDALCKLAADAELSVKNGAELLDRLVKDIVSESAATYASLYVTTSVIQDEGDIALDPTDQYPTAFSLPRFIPLLQERVNAQNPFVRSFLVSWITLLDQIPDLELVAFLPTFLAGLLRFLSDSNEDVHTSTKSALDRFLLEIRKIAEIKRNLAKNKRAKVESGQKDSRSSPDVVASPERAPNEPDGAETQPQNGEIENAEEKTEDHLAEPNEDADASDPELSLTAADDEEPGSLGFGDEWIPGQDVQVDYQRILAILIRFLSESREEEIQVTALTWIEAFLEICPEDILSFTPHLIQELLPALSHKQAHVCEAANRVNQLLMDYVMSLPEDHPRLAVDGPEDKQMSGNSTVPAPLQAIASVSAHAASALHVRHHKEHGGSEKGRGLRGQPATDQEQDHLRHSAPEEPDDDAESPSLITADLDYEAAVNALTLQFLHEKEATRVAALAWLIMLHRKSPRKILAIQDATFPALLKTLSDPAESVVTRDLLLLSQISKSSDDSYFTSFMVNLLKLFSTDRRLLETRGNLIIRQLCVSLSAERIYRTMADCLEQEEEDIEFAAIMVQNLNNNLITAPELADLRKRLRNLESSKDGQTFFTVLFKAWCVNSVATFSLCLLAQAYEQAYNLLQVFCDIEMTVNTLIQIDKLVQLLESPVFTYLRMQLLEPERHPSLYKCLYGVLMLLPQSSAFAALKNRLNSVSAIGYLHVPAPASAAASTSVRATPSSAPSSSNISNFDRQNRLKSRPGEEGGIKWAELFEKFRNTQERVRRAQQQRQFYSNQDDDAGLDEQGNNDHAATTNPRMANLRRLTLGASGSGAVQDLHPRSQSHAGMMMAYGSGTNSPAAAGNSTAATTSGHAKGKSSLGNLGRFTANAARSAAKGKK